MCIGLDMLENLLSNADTCGGWNCSFRSLLEPVGVCDPSRSLLAKSAMKPSIDVSSNPLIG